MKDRKFYVKDIEFLMERIAPKGLQESWDNSGFNIAFEESEVKNILTCLEIDERVISEARNNRCNVIVTHHPLIFTGIKILKSGDFQGKLIMRLIDNGISVYSCHTPFDKVKGGNNDMLTKLLGLSGVKNLDGEDVMSADKMIGQTSESDIGRIGKLKKTMSLEDMILLVCGSLKLRQSQLRISGDLSSEIKTVGICAGAGAEFIPKAQEQGCDLFITGDVKYHQAQEAAARGICIIDAGHYGTEKIFADNMKDKIVRELDGKVGAEVITSEINLDPFL